MMDPNLRNVAQKVAESYKWLSQCGVTLSPDKMMELATNMAVAASIKDAQDSLSRMSDSLNFLNVEIRGTVTLDEPVSISVGGKVRLDEPVSVAVNGNVGLYEPISVTIDS